MLPSSHHDFRLTSVLLIVILADPVGAATAGLGFIAAKLEFNAVALTESKSLKATLNNPTANPVSLTGVKLTGKDAKEFVQQSDCPDVLAAGGSCTYTLTFKPKTPKPRTATLMVTTGDPASPKLTLALQGNPYSTLNDTGITDCGDADSNDLPCPVVGFPRQDAEYGRDKTVNRDTDGHAGFSFTKLGANGKSLPSMAKEWNCVRDNMTGLIWEKKPVGDGIHGNQGLHDADDTYTWYSTDAGNNGGSKGYPDLSDNRACSGYNQADPQTWCNTEAYVNRVNQIGWCGAKDWRLPTRTELLSLVDLSITYPGPTIDKKYFDDAEANGSGQWYWSSSPYADSFRYAWNVGFEYGLSSNYVRHYSGAVRLVRSGQ